MQFQQYIFLFAYSNDSFVSTFLLISNIFYLFYVIISLNLCFQITEVNDTIQLFLAMLIEIVILMCVEIKGEGNGLIIGGMWLGLSGFSLIALYFQSVCWMGFPYFRCLVGS